MELHETEHTAELKQVSVLICFFIVTQAGVDRQRPVQKSDQFRILLLSKAYCSNSRLNKLSFVRKGLVLIDKCLLKSQVMP